jgi:hypothetical protein
LHVGQSNPAGCPGFFLLETAAMARSRTLAALAAVLALAAPAAALADSAGDNQYQDPFANSTPKTNTAPTTTPTTPTTPTAPPSSTPAPATNTSAGVSTAGTTAAASNASTDGQLPRTGLDLRLAGGLGLLLLAAGALIRRRLA